MPSPCAAPLVFHVSHDQTAYLVPSQRNPCITTVLKNHRTEGALMCTNTSIMPIAMARPTMR